MLRGVMQLKAAEAVLLKSLLLESQASGPLRYKLEVIVQAEEESGEILLSQDEAEVLLDALPIDGPSSLRDKLVKYHSSLLKQTSG